MKLLFFAVLSAATFMGMVRGQFFDEIPYSTLCGKDPKGPEGVHWVCFEWTQVAQVELEAHEGKVVYDPTDYQHFAVYVKHPGESVVLKSGYKDFTVEWNDKDGCVSLSGGIMEVACKGQLIRI